MTQLHRIHGNKLIAKPTLLLVNNRHQPTTPILNNFCFPFEACIACFDRAIVLCLSGLLYKEQKQLHDLEFQWWVCKTAVILAEAESKKRLCNLSRWCGKLGVSFVQLWQSIKAASNFMFCPKLAFSGFQVDSQNLDSKHRLIHKK